MGGAASALQYRKLKRIYSIYPDVAVHKDEFLTLLLHEEDIARLYISFNSLVTSIESHMTSGSKKQKMKKKPKKKISDTGDISASIVAILAYLRVTTDGNNKFAVRLFSTFDGNFSGKMGFRDFVFTVWNICTIDTASVDKLVYDLYKDSGKTGQMTMADIKQVIWDVYGENYSKHAVARRAFFSLDATDAKADMEAVPLDLFVEFCSRNDQLLQPVVLLRDKLQDVIVGLTFWHKHVKNRNYISGGRFMSVNKIVNKMKLAEKESKRKRNMQFLKLAYGKDDKSQQDLTEENSSIESLSVKTEKKLKKKQGIFQHFEKLGKLENFFTYEGKVYRSPYKGMKKPPSKHTQKKIYVKEKERRLGIDPDDPDSLEMTRAKKKAERKQAKLSRVQALQEDKEDLEEENHEKEVLIEDLENELDAKNEEIARLKNLLKKRHGH